jgi:hypothetical protein
MRAPCLIYLVLVALPLTAAARPSTSYTGVRYPPLPEGCHERGGMLLPQTSDAGFGLKEVTCHGVGALWLARLTHRDAQQRPHWEVLDVMPLPTPRPGQTVVNDDCAFEGGPDPSIHAVGTWLEKEVGGSLESITFAARPNLDRLKLERLPASQVTCGHDEDRD